MRPSDKIVEITKSLFFDNHELVVECFLAHSPLWQEGNKTNIDGATISANNISQSTVDLLYMTFCLGMIEVMLPDSRFNTEFSSAAKEKLGILSQAMRETKAELGI